MRGLRAFGTRAFLLLALTAIVPQPALPDSFSLPHGDQLTDDDLPPDFRFQLKKLGGRMMDKKLSRVTVSGTLTDAVGAHAASLKIQAPGYLKYEDDSGRTIKFNGFGFHGKGGADLDSVDETIAESLLAHYPDSVYIGVGRGGYVRRIGTHFRNDDGKTLEYTGPFWTLYAFFPGRVDQLPEGKALRQHIFIAVDENTALLSEVRIVDGNVTPPRVVQTVFGNWVQQSGQWFPQTIQRLENGRQTFRFDVTQNDVGSSVDTSEFQP